MVKTVWGIVAAAGRARRFGGDKLAHRLSNGETVLRRSCSQLIAGGIERLVVVGSPGPEHALDELGDPLAAVIPGGAQRSDSIRAGLAAIPDHAEWVAVHDAARPFVSAKLVSKCLAAAQLHGAAVPVLECIDTIAQADATTLVAALERSLLKRVQTPQIMRRDLLEEVVAQASSTDESSVLLRLGHPVETVEGEEENIKVTHAADLEVASRKYVTGFGFDVHRYDERRSLWLGGVEIQGEPGLAGHSDADVILHALVDAILGGIGKGDIGQHFPPSDDRFKDAASSRFVEHTMNLVKRADARLEHVDITLIGEKPRLTPHRQVIRERLVALLGLPIESINVKATTTEGLGFTGRGEGLAAQAVASLSLPAVKEPAR
jgi:2-C-methyl-D-erythritol 4-phosphate cytidylyltransferase/2-C-methyl-D-erythritol 2,4-cyclodiphosphate synthase